ncbi:MAG: hypothetical protein AB7E61_06810 [Acholeplasmataceae bacterium]
MSIEKKELLKDQIFREKAKYLTMCIPSKGHILAAYLLDIIIIVSVITVLILKFELNNVYKYASTFGFVIIYAMIRFKTAGKTLGMIIFGVGYAREYDGTPLDNQGYKDLFLGNIAADIKYNDVYETYSFYTSYRNQTIAMQKANIVYVKTRMYKELMKQGHLPFYNDPASVSKDEDFRLKL